MAQDARLGFDAGGAADFQLDSRGWRLVSEDVDPLQIQVGARSGLSLERDATYCDLLDQLPVVSIESIEPIDPVVFLFVRGGVPQDEERLELLQRFNRLRSSIFWGSSRIKIGRFRAMTSIGLRV